ncbi:MAG: DNA polymerase III subunit beta, partial [Acidobacteria bacterium]|nr:DNA polymerase III subunit beta [Acidobacteriota bacterium]
MEFSVQRAEILKEVGLCQGVVERKTTIPILSNLLLEAAADSVQITATDLELGIRSSFAAKVKKGGVATVPAKKLFDYVRQLEEAEVRFKATDTAAGGSVQLSCGRSQVRMAGMARENFPVLPEFPDKLAIIPPQILLQMIHRTAFAISSEESRYTLNASLLILKAETMTMVATDGHRLAHIETDPSVVQDGYSGVSGEVRVLVPKKAMTELAKQLADAPADVGIEFAKDNNHLFFRIGSRLLISRLLSGQFPNYEAVLPRGNERVAVLDREQLTAALRRVSLFSDERSHAIRLQLGKEELKVSSAGAESWESEDSLPVNYSAAPLQIGFNWQYLLDFLAAVESSQVTLEFKEEQSAGQMQPAEEKKL